MSVIDDFKKVINNQKKAREKKAREKKIKKIESEILGLTDEQKLDKLQDDEELTSLQVSVIVRSIQSPKVRIKALGRVRRFIDTQQEIIDSLDNDELRLQALDYVEEKIKAIIIKSMESPEYILKALPSVNDDYKAKIVSEKDNDDLKLKSLGLISRENIHLRDKIIVTMSKLKNVLQACKENNVYSKSEIEHWILNSLRGLVDEDDEILEFLESDVFGYDMADIDKYVAIASIKDNLLRLKSLTFIKGKYERKEKAEWIVKDLDDPEVKQLVERMISKNADLLKNIDFRFFDKKYLDTLGEDRINVISCFPQIQNSIIQLNDTQLYVFDRCIDVYLKDHPNIDEWTVLADEILKNINEYGELFSNLGEVDDVKELSDDDIRALTNIIQNNNFFEIKDINDVRNVEQIRSKKLNGIIEGKYYLYEKREAVIQKLFGFSGNYFDSCLEKFGKDIENIDEGYSKDFIRALKEIKDIDDEEVLKEIFDSCSALEVDKTLIERDLKTEYCKKFNEGLYRIKDEDLVEGTTNEYEAGTDFKIIMTAVGAYSGINPENYKLDWNRPSLSSQHMCTSYIRNDMIGTAPINNICYGFSSMKEDALMLSSNADIGSSAEGFVSTSVGAEAYYAPNGQIDHTEIYNEMDFRRIQDGKKKQPDYILVFRKNGEITKIEEARKAARQWGENPPMPIVIVDIDKCLSEERKKVDEMLEQYHENGSIELAKQIHQKVRNNRVTDKDFCKDLSKEISDIDDRVFEEEYEHRYLRRKEQTVDIESLKDNFENVSAEERESVSIKIRKLYRKILEIKRGNDSDGR